VDGRWEGQLRLADGSRKYIYARNRRELITRLQEERWRLASGMPVRARGLTLADYATQWLDVMRSRLRPTTFAGYELCLGRAVRMLGSVPIARLTPQLIQACYAGLLAEGLSPRTVLHTHAVLHRALKQARHWGLTSSLPTELVSVPRLPYREMQALSKAQLEVLFETGRATRWYPLWVLLGTTGLRIGEALGLRWSDVDLLAGRLQIRRALQRQRGRGLVFVEPKSVTSRRCVELPQLAIAVLKEQRLHVDGELVFPNREGEPVEPGTVSDALKVHWTEPGCRESGFTTCGTRLPPSYSRPGCIPSWSSTCSATAPSP
jgi:integrase